MLRKEINSDIDINFKKTLKYSYVQLKLWEHFFFKKNVLLICYLASLILYFKFIRLYLLL